MCFKSNDVKQAPPGVQKRSKTTGRIKNPKPELKEKIEAKSFKALGKSGPFPKRSCTDIPCLVIFLAFIVFQVYYSIWAYTKGNPWNLAQPYDIDGNPCAGTTSPTKDYKYAYFFHPVKDLTGTICLKSCPTWGVNDAIPTTIGDCYLGLQATIKTGRGNTAVGATVCNEAVYLDLNQPESVLSAIASDKERIYKTTPFIDRFCIPDVSNLEATAQVYYKKITSNTQMSDKFEEYFSDLKNSYLIICLSSVGALIICLAYMFLLQLCVGVFVWVMILGFFVILILLAIFSHRKANYYTTLYNQTQNDTYLTTQRKFYYVALFIDFVIFLLFCRKFINLTLR